MVMVLLRGHDLVSLDRLVLMRSEHVLEFVLV